MQLNAANKTGKKNINNSPADYQDLVRVWQSQVYEPDLVDYKQSFLENHALSAILGISPCVTSVLDLRTQQVNFISSNTNVILGYDSSYFTEKGLAFYNEIAHPEDLPKTWKLIKKIWNFILEVPPDDQTQFKFNYDYRIIKPDGKEVRVLAQNSVLQSDSKGNITHVLGVYSDISHWKKSEHQMGSIVSATDGFCYFFTCNDSDTNKPQTSLSKRELEIVKLLAKGYSSKLIAEELFISFNTVNTHRQKIIEKTNSKNTGGVVQFAASHGLI